MLVAQCAYRVVKCLRRIVSVEMSAAYEPGVYFFGYLCRLPIAYGPQRRYDVAIASVG